MRVGCKKEKPKQAKDQGRKGEGNKPGEGSYQEQ